MDPTSADLLTWLNGRAIEIRVVHKSFPTLIWHPQDGITIEDSILIFADRNQIDIKKEIDL